MKVKDLIREWQTAPHVALTAHEYHVRLSIRDAARIAALLEMYPATTEARLITDLLSAALDELEAALPYVPGSRVIAEDDQGDPIYEDVGGTARFLELTKKYTIELERQSASG